MHNGRRISRTDNDDRYDVTDERRSEAGSAISISTLTMSDLNGGHSGSVECSAVGTTEPFSDPIVSRANIDVLGKQVWLIY